MSKSFKLPDTMEKTAECHYGEANVHHYGISDVHIINLDQLKEEWLDLRTHLIHYCSNFSKKDVLCLYLLSKIQPLHLYTITFANCLKSF